MNENPGCNRGLPWPWRKRKPAVVIESSSEAEEQETLGVQRGGKGDMPDSRRDGEKRRHTPDTSRNKKERRNDAWKSGLESWTSTDDRSLPRASTTMEDSGKDTRFGKMNGSPGRCHRLRRTIGIGGRASRTACRMRENVEDSGAVVDGGMDVMEGIRA